MEINEEHGLNNGLILDVVKYLIASGSTCTVLPAHMKALDLSNRSFPVRASEREDWQCSGHRKRQSL